MRFELVPDPNFKNLDLSPDPNFSKHELVSGLNFSQNCFSRIFQLLAMFRTFETFSKYSLTVTVRMT
jgi:hypothetical protein